MHFEILYAVFKTVVLSRKPETEKTYRYIESTTNLNVYDKHFLLW